MALTTGLPEDQADDEDIGDLPGGGGDSGPRLQVLGHLLRLERVGGGGCEEWEDKCQVL